MLSLPIATAPMFNSHAQALCVLLQLLLLQLLLPFQLQLLSRRAGAPTALAALAAAAAALAAA